MANAFAGEDTNFDLDIEVGNIDDGYNISNQYYTDLAWGGLTDWRKRDANGNIVKDSHGNTVYEETDWFKKAYPKASDRARVKNNLAAEQGLSNTNKQKGRNGGC